MKVVINAKYGGFSLSEEAFDWLVKNKGWKITEYTKDGNGYLDKTAKIVEVRDRGPFKTFPKYYLTTDSSRTPDIRCNPDIIECVEKLGTKADGRCARLKIVEIPDGTDFVIEEYDGNEWVSERHRTWS